MLKSLKISFLLLLIISCSHKKQIIYLNDINNESVSKALFKTDKKILIGDILKIDINTVISEASIPYKTSSSNNEVVSNLDVLLVQGYSVEKDSMINFPVIGKIKAVNLTENEMANKIAEILKKDGHLNNPHVKVKIINSKFTVLGEVNSPGTYTNYSPNLNVFQALGTAGDLLITAKRDNVVLLREENGLLKTYKFSLNSKKLLNKPYYYIKSNDVIIIEPNFSKIKSAGFIGSPNSIASISSLLLSITLLLINSGN